MTERGPHYTPAPGSVHAPRGPNSKEASVDWYTFHVWRVKARYQTRIVMRRHRVAL